MKTARRILSLMLVLVLLLAYVPVTANAVDGGTPAEVWIKIKDARTGDVVKDIDINYRYLILEGSEYVWEERSLPTNGLNLNDDDYHYLMYSYSDITVSFAGNDSYPAQTHTVTRTKDDWDNQYSTVYLTPYQTLTVNLKNSDGTALTGATVKYGDSTLSHQGGGKYTGKYAYNTSATLSVSSAGYSGKSETVTLGGDVSKSYTLDCPTLTLDLDKAPSGMGYVLNMQTGQSYTVSPDITVPGDAQLVVISGADNVTVTPNGRSNWTLTPTAQGTYDITLGYSHGTTVHQTLNLGGTVSTGTVSTPAAPSIPTLGYGGYESADENHQNKTGETFTLPSDLKYANKLTITASGAVSKTQTYTGLTAKGTLTMDFGTTARGPVTYSFTYASDTVNYSGSPSNVSKNYYKSVPAPTVDNTEFTYNGAKQAPTVSIPGLTEGTDYTVTTNFLTDAQYFNMAAGDTVLPTENMGSITYNLPDFGFGSSQVTADVIGYRLAVTGKTSSYYFGSQYVDYTIGKRPITVTAKEQNILFGESVAAGADAVTVSGSGLVPGHSISLTATPSTTEATDHGTVTVSNVQIKNGSTDVTAHYDVTLVPTAKLTVSKLKESDLTILVPTSVEYDGNAQEPVTVKLGSKTLTPGTDYTATYQDNTNVGTAKVTLSNANWETDIVRTFQITEKPLTESMVTLSSYETVYSGTAVSPTIAVFDGSTTLEMNKDYTVQWDSEDFISAGTRTVTVTGIGNYKNSVTCTFTVKEAELTGVSVTQSQSLTYSGQAQPPAVTEQATAVNGQTVTFRYSATKEGTYGSLPAFENAGTYTVYYEATAPNHTKATGSFEVKVDKKEITPPTLAGKRYTGTTLTADVPVSDSYTVSSNEGGIGAGTYPVTLVLSDPANNTWPNSDDSGYTCQFTVEQAENQWVVTPDIADWVYNETASIPTYEAEFGDVTVTYAGTANDGTEWNDSQPPTLAGTYSVTFAVSGNNNYTSISADVPFKVKKADYDMSAAEWDYTDALHYDGKVKTVGVVGLPEGVTVEGYSDNEGIRPAEHTASVTLGYDEYNYNTPTIDDLAWKIVNEWTPTEYVTSGEGWRNGDFVITPQEGYLISTGDALESVWENGLLYTEETTVAGDSQTFYLMEEATGKISLPVTVEWYIDKTLPAGTITIDDLPGWKQLLNTVSFGLFFKDQQTVFVAAEDALSGVAAVEIYESPAAMTAEEVAAITEWAAYDGGTAVTVEDAKTFVCYARITDAAGNRIVISTDGGVYDVTPPEITGITDGAEYYTSRVAVITDANLKTVTLNGQPAEAPVSLAGDRDAVYEIVAVDEAGNETAVTVTVKPLADIEAPLGQLDGDNVTSDELEKVTEVRDQAEQVDLTDATEEEKTAVQEIIDRCEELLEALEEAQNAVPSPEVTETMETTKDNVTFEDAEALEKAKEHLEKVLEDYNGNYTDAEKQEIQQSIERMEEAMESLEKVESAVEAIAKLPETVVPDDEDAEQAILEAKEAYEALSDHEKSLIGDEVVQKLDTLLMAIGDYRIILGDDGQWQKDSAKTLSFTANGPFRKFDSVKVDGKVIEPEHYTAQAGSTVVTLKDSYLQTLSVGEHTITVVYTDGDAEGSFTVNAAPEPPKNDEPDTDGKDEPDTDGKDEPDTDGKDEPDTDKKDEPDTDGKDEPDTDKKDEPDTDKKDDKESDSVDTGDDGRILLWLVLICMGGAGILTITAGRKRIFGK